MLRRSWVKICAPVGEGRNQMEPRAARHENYDKNNQGKKHNNKVFGYLPHLATFCFLSKPVDAFPKLSLFSATTMIV